MVETNGTSPVYIGGNDGGFGMGGSGFIWAFLIFALLMGNGGFGFGNNNALGYENLATSNEVQRGFDNQNAMANQREILSAVNDASARGIAATEQTFHDTLAAIGDKYDEIQRDNAELRVGQANILAKQNECCCEQKMLVAQTGADINANIAQNRYDNAMNTAAINANVTAQTQKVLDVLAQNKIEALQGKVNQLELAQAMNGVVRYPNGMMYNAGTSPFCPCGNGGWGYPV